MVWWGSMNRKEKPIPGHPGFYARDNGEIIGKRGKPLKGHVDRCGYHEVLFSENGCTKNYLVHRLVLSAFAPIENMERYDVNHKNGNKLDNSLDNLEWSTRSENVKHSYSHGLQSEVTNPHGTFRVLSEDDIQKILKLHSDGLLDREIAEIIGCSRELVSRKIREGGLR